MALVVKFEDLQSEEAARGLRRATITNGETSWMSADLLSLDAGAALEESVPAGSDAYLFVRRGSATISADGASREMEEQATAVVAEGVRFELRAGQSGCEAVLVVAPPEGAGSGLPGIAGGLTISRRGDLPKVEVPEQKKVRNYIVGKQSIPSERGHAMIVDYVSDTVTAMHHHPNADSMFVPLEGEFAFSVDGKDVVVGPGGAAVFKAGDRHSVRCAEGTNGGNFLEFHVPAAFTTVKEQG